MKGFVLAVLVGLQVIGTLYNVSQVGKFRTRITPSDAVGCVVIGAAVIAGLLYVGS